MNVSNENEFDETQIIVKKPNLINSAYIAGIRYKYPTGESDRLVIETSWFTCPNLFSRILNECQCGDSHLFILINELSLEHLLRVITNELLSRKQSIIESVIQDVNTDDWNDSVLVTRKNNISSMINYWIPFKLGNAAINNNGLPISLDELMTRRIGRCGIKLLFKLGFIHFNESSAENKLYGCTYDIISMEIDMDSPTIINPDDANVMLVVEI